MANSFSTTFRNAPIREVACAVVFNTAKPLDSSFHGLFWESLRERFPRFEDQPPVPVNIGSMPNQIQFGFSTLPPLRRAWLLDPQGRYLIQLQQDLFTFNWRLGPPEEKYPRFPAIYSDFKSIFDGFQKFVNFRGFGELTCQQLQLSYVNVIDGDSGLGAIRADEAVVGASLAAPWPASTGSDRLNPESLNWSSTYLLPENIGRLTWNAQTALMLPKMNNSLRIEIGVQGIIPHPVETPMDLWFQRAHDWICELFLTSTNPALHEVWGKETT